MSKEKDSKLKALQLTLDKLDKTYGKGTVMKLGDAEVVKIDSISSGSLTLDGALGVGGYPKGRVIEIYGPESSGKTTLTLHAIAECQKAGGIAAFIDAEHAFDRFYAQNLGINIDELIISQPDNGEQALEIADNLIRSGAIDIIVIDSVAALTPRSEIEGEMGDSKMGLHARLMSQALRKLTSNISKTNCTVMFINQLREKIGVMFGNPETTTGGNALKFYASVRLDIRRSTQIKDTSGNVLGNKTRVKVVKNKVAPPFKVSEFDIMYGKGISKLGEIIDLGVEHDIIDKSGSWFSYGDTKLGQGRDSVKTILTDNPELSDEIEAKIIEIIKKTITSYHLSLFINHLWVAEVKTNIPINDVIITTIACQIFSTPIKSNSWLNKKTIGRIPVRRLYQRACTPVFSGSPPEIAAAAKEAKPTGGVTSAIKPK